MCYVAPTPVPHCLNSNLNFAALPPQAPCRLCQDWQSPPQAGPHPHVRSEQVQSGKNECDPLRMDPGREPAFVETEQKDLARIHLGPQYCPDVFAKSCSHLRLLRSAGQASARENASYRYSRKPCRYRERRSTPAATPILDRCNIPFLPTAAQL